MVLNVSGVLDYASTITIKLLRPSMKLPPGWYAILSSDELTPYKPLGVERFGQALVLWRDESGAPVVMRDLCPHRSAKLSLGKLKDNRVQCPFHGFEFDTAGSCRYVPETEKPAENLCVDVFPVQEIHNLIWVWYGSSNKPSLDPPWFAELEEGLLYCQFTDLWPCHITRCIENQLDYAHLPFVHASTIGRFASTSAKPEVELADERIKFRPNAEKNKVAFIEYRFPNIWQNYIKDGFMIFLAFAPVNETSTNLYLRTYYRGVAVPILKDLVDWFFNITNGIILGQDRSVVLSQGSSSSLEATGERLFLSDIPIRHFRKRWQETQGQS